ncbi:MAG: rod-binding protein [Alphaproteobacteria bacterium]
MNGIATTNNLNFFSLRPAPEFNVKEAEKTAEDFEAFFISNSMENMSKGIETDELFGGGHAEEVFKSMLFDEYGKIIARAGSIGVKDSVMDSMLKMQEASNNE